MNDAIRPAVARAALSSCAVVERAGGSHERHSPKCLVPSEVQPGGVHQESPRGAWLWLNCG